MIDSHVHLDDEKFAADVEDVIQRAEAAGMRAMVSAGVDLASSRAVVAMAQRHAPVFVAVGFHPHTAAAMRPGDAARLRALALQPKVVAIGEIGLDYYREHSPRDVQRSVLRQQLDLAAGLGLPVVVHSREAADDTSEILSAWAVGVRPRYEGGPLGMMHCFSGDLAAALRYIELGFYISLAGPVTYPNSHRTRQVAAGVPLARLLAETDAPYLPPQGQRGRRNEPANVRAVVEHIAALRGLTPQQAAAQTASNAQTLFRLPVAVGADLQ